ncbi:three component ABC system middle component [Actinoplanes awajinensis]|uniref:Uncharacterized protein n=1 Tax=Actinoplanes awajinensis subsp. mycoplanecinus TaxID=135947 RepID=A0A124G7H6_9ACTN|nr:three component ABC system middle component [Actinoplanes awajinensis]KUL22840.1 hypothetical protein ADL15_47500 [Actinoplanes awajinensis subsp. mycoplanecinus]
MSSWHNRPQVTAAYLNPALIASIIATAARSYETGRQQPMAWPLAFIVVPLLLHRPTREQLPSSTATHLSTWISRNALLQAGFAERAASLVPPIREGLRFGLRHGALTIINGGLSGSLRPAAGADLRSLFNSARMVGRWLAKTEHPATVFALFGVEP